MTAIDGTTKKSQSPCKAQPGGRSAVSLLILYEPLDRGMHKGLGRHWSRAETWGFFRERLRDNEH
jgi:hypothetical protein